MVVVTISDIVGLVFWGIIILIAAMIIGILWVEELKHKIRNKRRKNEKE